MVSSTSTMDLSLWSLKSLLKPVWFWGGGKSGALTQYHNILRCSSYALWADVASRSLLLVHYRLWARFTTVFGDLSILLHVTWDLQKCLTRLHPLFRLYYNSWWRFSWGSVFNFFGAMTALFSYTSEIHMQHRHQNQNEDPIKWKK